MNPVAEKLLKEDPVLQDYLNQVLEHLHPEKVILFGSKAHQTAVKGSDTDLAVETNAPFNDLDIIGAVDIVDLNNADPRLRDRIFSEG